MKNEMSMPPLILVMFLALVVSEKSLGEPSQIWFGYGGKTQLAKLSLSLNIKLSHHWQVRYQQNGFWDLSARSSPFKEINHSPSLEYSEFVLASKLKLGLGVDHISNGVDNQTKDYTGESRRSRTAHRLITRLSWWESGSRMQLVLASPLLLGTRTDLLEFLPHNSLQGEFSWGRGRLGVSSRGKVNLLASLNLARIPLTTFESHNSLMIQLEGFAGYGETLVDYKKQTYSLRLGVSTSLIPRRGITPGSITPQDYLAHWRR